MPSVSALADVDISGMALSHLSLSTTVQSLSPPDPGSAAAQACAFWYPKCRNELLQNAPWNFADTDTLLTSDASAYPGWQYFYQYPNDCLQPIAVSTAAGVRYGTSYWNNWWFPYPTQQMALPKVPFKIFESQATAGQSCIACDYPAPMYLFYIQCVTNTAMFDPMFATALSYLLASRVGGPLRADKDKIADCRAQYSSMRLQALAQHLNANQQDPERDSPSILVRG